MMSVAETIHKRKSVISSALEKYLATEIVKLVWCFCTQKVTLSPLSVKKNDSYNLFH